MSEKMRDEFEKWAISCDMCTYLDDAEYRHQSTELSWRAWKASRAALVVELPKTPHFSASDEADLAYELAIDDMKDTIESLGVRCK